MLELIALICGVVLTIWQPIEARKVAGGWTRPRFRGTRDEFRVAYRRQLTLFLWLGVFIATANIGMGALLEDDPARRIARFVTAAVWLGVAASSFVSRRIVDGAPR
ncbi:hypothetical protein [Roseomonas fluvialis]|uniref:Uncharacterized protein n=1 Tax=Roseomonas fluvialis TaxID=1750527 RepID=A0ABM7Y5W1_9PROT|nr:hypothetical protein [Roseomonas fluvialis]BDG73355.1 hypothetical protein Rmf_32840 [Roseomonas fluvialis]